MVGEGGDFIVSPSPTTRLRLVAALILPILGVACAPMSDPPQLIEAAATATVPPAPGDLFDIPTRQPEPTTTPLVTAPPALVLPGADGTSVACPANTLRLPLTIDGEPVAAASRLESLGDDLYLVADGGLYALDRLSADAGAPILTPLLVPGDRVAGRTVQELTDAAADPTRSTVYTLDKAGHVYRIPLGGGDPSLAYRAHENPDEALQPQIAAVTVDERGRLILLDTALGFLWTTDGLESLVPVNESLAETSGIDVAAASGALYLLRNEGIVNRITDHEGAYGFYVDSEQAGLSLFVGDPLGVPLLYAVDGPRRAITGLDPGSAQLLTRLVFAFPGMGLLRDAAFAGGRLYALADGDLYVYPGPADDDQTPVRCAPPAETSFPRPKLYGVDLIGTLSRFQIPLDELYLPIWPRVYPGAARLYRVGVHHGLDIYHWNGPGDFGIGTPVYAMGAGKVVKATLNYEPMTSAEFEQLVRLSDSRGGTPDEALDRFAGKQVVIDHGNGVRTAYLHLDEIAPGVRVGSIVHAGQQIGTVGNTGTQGEDEPGAAAPHLHVEIWIGDRYLGQGITVAETMWWYEELFGE